MNDEAAGKHLHEKFGRKKKIDETIQLDIIAYFLKQLKFIQRWSWCCIYDHLIYGRFV